MNNQRHTESQNNLLHQDIRRRVGTLILHREGLRPFTEIVGDHQNVAIGVRRRVTDVQNVHHNTIQAMTGRNITQRMMSSSWRLPLDAHDALAEPFLHIIRHSGPIEAMGQSCQCSITIQMASKQRSMVWQKSSFRPGFGTNSCSKGLCVLLFRNMIPLSSTVRLLR